MFYTIHLLITFYGYLCVLVQLYMVAAIPQYRAFLLSVVKTMYKCVREQRRPNTMDILMNMSPSSPPLCEEMTHQYSDSDSDSSDSENDDAVPPPSERSESSLGSCPVDAVRSKKLD